MSSSHLPIRECIGCGGKFLKSDLLRIGKQKDRIFFDPGAKAQGRGAYLCKNFNCLTQCVKRKKLNRAFRQNVSEETYQNLAEEMGRFCE